MVQKCITGAMDGLIISGGIFFVVSHETKPTAYIHGGNGPQLFIGEYMVGWVCINPQPPF